MRRLLPLLVVPALACAHWFTTEMEDTSTLQGALGVYRASDEKKAIAIAADESGKRSWGAFYGSYSQDHANEKALERCRKNAKRHVQAPCHLFAVGDVPAHETALACRAGRVNPKRCGLQDRFFELYPR